MDKNLEKICKIVAEEESISEEKVEFILRHLCNWTRQSLIDLEYSAVLWNKLGAFKVIPKRAKEHKDTLDEFKKTFKSDNRSE